MLKMEKDTQLMIIGNGFDRACGLESTYSSFFKYHYSKIFNLKNKPATEFNVKELKDKFYKLRDDALSIFKSFHDKNNRYNELLKKYPDLKNVNCWDLIFLAMTISQNNSKINLKWCDVEDTILQCINSLLIKNVFPVSDPSTDFFIQQISSITLRQTFSEGNSKDNYSLHLLNELHKFEDTFAKYIVKLMENSNYNHNVIEMIKNLYDENSYSLSCNKISILSFNYSADMRIKNAFNEKPRFPSITHWSNIHGLAAYKNGNVRQIIGKGNEVPSPIFGVDNHDITSFKEIDGVKKDPRFFFTKAYRLLENKVNNIREPFNYTDIKLITIMGHSLNSADYTYFITIFNNVHLYDSDVCLEVYYYANNNKMHDTQEERMAIRNISNLLINYGNTIDDFHGQNIMNKLVLEKRISIIPNHHKFKC